ncbi:hypothetical protein ACM9HO_03630 [Pseudomonas sp. KHB2.9]|jgi:hypothetical protein
MADRFLVEARPRNAIRNPRQDNPNDPYFGINEMAFHVIDTLTGDSVESHDNQKDANLDAAARNEAFPPL